MAEAVAVRSPTAEVGIEPVEHTAERRRSRRDGSFDDRGHALNFIQVHAGFARELYQIGPNSIRMRQTFPNAHRATRQAVKRHIAAARLVTRCAERVYRCGRKIFFSPSACDSYHLGQTCRSRLMPDHFQTRGIAEQLAIGERAQA